MFPCWLQRVGEPVPHMRWGWGQVLGSGQRGWAGFLFPLCGAVCRNHDQYPAFAPGCSEIPLGFWSICILLLIIFPNCTCMQLFLAPYNFFVLWCLMWLLSWYTHCSKLSQPVSFPTEGSTPLFLRVKGPKLSSIKTLCWTVSKLWIQFLSLGPALFLRINSVEVILFIIFMLISCFLWWICSPG